MNYIEPTNWVWFTEHSHTTFGRFDLLNKRLKSDLEELYSQKHHKYFLLFDVYKKLAIHLILPEEGERYARKLHFLFKAASSRDFSIFRMASGNHWLARDLPEFEPLWALNDQSLGHGCKKQLALQYIDLISKSITIPDPPTFSERKVDMYWVKWDNEIKELLSRFRKPEEKPMKVTKHLIELNKYDKERKTTTGEREGIVVKYKSEYPTSSRDVILLLESIYINTDDQWDLTQNILTIGDGSYVIASGDTTYTEERFKLLCDKKGVLDEVDMIGAIPCKFYFEEKIGEKKKTGVEYFRVPHKVRISKVLEFYQKKYPNKNYTLNKESKNKELSERSQILNNLPKPGETPAKNLRKVCYKRKDGYKIFRGFYDEVNALVEKGDYEFASKVAWKRQMLWEDGVVKQRGVSNITNITQSPSGKPLGERSLRRELKKEERQRNLIKKANTLYYRRLKRKPGDAERAIRSDQDRQLYIKKKKEEKKPINTYRASRAFEAVILGDNAAVLGTVYIKAKSNDHAEKILKIIMKNKGKDAKLTGNVREWITQTGKNRKKRGT